MDAMEEIPLVVDAEMCSEEEGEEQPAGRRFVNLRKLGVGAVVLALGTLAYVAAKHNGNENSAQVADTIGIVQLDTITTNGGNTIIGGQGNIQSNGGHDNTITSQLEIANGGDAKFAQQQAKQCEGSGNGPDGVAVGVVCCKGPGGVCCGAAAAAKDLYKNAQSKATTTSTKCTYGTKKIPNLKPVKLPTG